MKKLIIFITCIIIGIVTSEYEQTFAKAEEKSGVFVPKAEISSLIQTYAYEPSGIIYRESHRNINAIDPDILNNVNSYYPGLRGPNQLIVYTPKYGYRTGTNEYGTEAIVENNMVIGLNGADSVIPYNGFVISGHGKAKNWIMQNIQIGTKVYIDYENNTIRCFLTPDSLVFAAKEKIKEVNSLVEYYKQIDRIYNDKTVNSYINSSKDFLKQAEIKPEQTKTFIEEAMNLLDKAIKNAIPCFNNELKGIWVRPTENTPEKIIKTLDRMQEAGITDIFLETYYHGKTIYKSEFLTKMGVTSQRKEFEGFDPLSIWIDEAHKRKIKVHIWFECFYLGNDDPKLTAGHILNVYPAWTNKRLINYASRDPIPSLSEHNGYFLDPANAEVQEFVLGVLREITQNYDIDGINLDYIRYPKTVEKKSPNYTLLNWGYTNTARTQFKTIYGIDPIDIKSDTVDWELWSLFRQNKISDFVREAKHIAKEKNVILTAVIFPDLDKSISINMQNWKLWSQRNYVDGLTPLILSGDKNTAVSLLQNVTDNVDSSTDIYPGIFVTFMGGTFEDLLMQIHKTREYRTKGTILFDYAHLNDNYIEALKTRIFNNKYDNDKNEHTKERKKRKEDYNPEVKYLDNKPKRSRR